jgi:hypothetical protein
MAKRNLRIIKRVRNIPIVGTCEFCNMQFHVEPRPHGLPSESQAAMQQQFNAHKCKLEAASPEAGPDAEEAATERQS